MKLHNLIAASLLLGTVSISAGAQSKLNMQGANLLERYRTERAERVRTLGLKAVEAQPVPREGAIVMLNDGESADCLRQKGFEVISDLGNIATVNVSLDSVDILVEMPQVKSVSMGGKKRLLMHKARTASHVSEAHEGIEFNGTTTKFDGTGVVVGLMDGGMEPNHVNFVKDDGTRRVKRLWAYTGNGSTPRSYTTESAIKAFTTEDRKETHGTHVTGIMAGSYNGTGKYYTSSKPTNGKIPFYGVATGADIAMSCGDAYDSNITDGVKRIIEYAEKEGKPAAVNLSLGNNTGPHDGSDLLSQSLGNLGKRGIICIAAGNEGEDKLSIEKTFTAGDTEVKTFMYVDPTYGLKGIYSHIDIWGSDSTPLTVTLAIYKSSTKQLTTLATIDGAKSGTINRSSNSTAISSGSLTFSAGVDANNNRFNLNIDSNMLTMNTGYYLVIRVTGKAGQKVNMYCEGYASFSGSHYGPTGSPLSGYTHGTPDQSINAMACGENVLVVGAYTTVSNYYAQGGLLYNPYKAGDIAGYSSYGNRFQGEALPHVCAPGSTIISSYNRHYVEYCTSTGYEEYGTEPYMSATATAINGSSTDYWGGMDGTSMATPYMTGVAALWLQADNSLTIDDIKEVLKKTSTNDTYTAADPRRWGAGKVNAADGLRYILARNASLGAVEQELTSDNIMLAASEGNLHITALGASALQAAVYSISGMEVAAAKAQGDMLDIDTAGLTSGVYLVRVTSSTGSVTKKIVL